MRYDNVVENAEVDEQPAQPNV